MKILKSDQKQRSRKHNYVIIDYNPSPSNFILNYTTWINDLKNVPRRK